MSLLQTIRIPKNLLFLSDKLPQANYDKPNINKKHHSFNKKSANELPDIKASSVPKKPKKEAVEETISQNEPRLPSGKNVKRSASNSDAAGGQEAGIRRGTSDGPPKKPSRHEDEAPPRARQARQKSPVGRQVETSQHYISENGLSEIAQVHINGGSSKPIKQGSGSPKYDLPQLRSKKRER